MSAPPSERGDQIGTHIRQAEQRQTLPAKDGSDILMIVAAKQTNHGKPLGKHRAAFSFRGDPLRSCHGRSRDLAEQCATCASVYNQTFPANLDRIDDTIIDEFVRLSFTETVQVAEAADRVEHWLHSSPP
ncbi:hypothetical protein DMC47_16215 [Nostoc sp. 3335mG]|nr:hypothetical protein DMC47_16215 [Nostoc sp. 3335mG]